MPEKTGAAAQTADTARGETILLRVKRQDTPDSAPYWDEFRVASRPFMNVVAALMEIQKNPVNAAGRRVAPVVWDCNCLEEVCGACAMLVNGRARQACSALVKDLAVPITLEPLSKFPVVRDLMVDRAVMFENLKKVKAWIAVDGTRDAGPGPRVPQRVQALNYQLARCMTCGCCMEACPQVNRRSGFIGPAVLAQAKLFNSHPLGRALAAERLEAIMGPGGIAACGKAQNCQKACPKQLPLTQALAGLGRQTSIKILTGWFTR